MYTLPLPASKREHAIPIKYEHHTKIVSGNAFHLDYCVPRFYFYQVEDVKGYVVGTFNGYAVSSKPLSRTQARVLTYLLERYIPDFATTNDLTIENKFFMLDMYKHVLDNVK